MALLRLASKTWRFKQHDRGDLEALVARIIQLSQGVLKNHWWDIVGGCTTSFFRHYDGFLKPTSISWYERVVSCMAHMMTVWTMVGADQNLWIDGPWKALWFTNLKVVIIDELCKIIWAIHVQEIDHRFHVLSGSNSYPTKETIHTWDLRLYHQESRASLRSSDWSSGRWPKSGELVKLVRSR